MTSSIMAATPLCRGRGRKSSYRVAAPSLRRGPRMIKVDIMRRLDPEMAAALNLSRRLDMDLVAARGGPIAPDDLAGQRAAYDHERAFWNEIKPALAAVEAVGIPRPGGAVRCRLYRPG